MNRKRYSRIAHTGIRFWNPLDENELVRVAAELPISSGDRVLDYGCGDGELLVELAARHDDLRVTGVDINEDAVAICREKVEGTFLAKPFHAELFEPESFDLVLNIGASPGFKPLVEQIAPLVGVGGRLLIGDGYWQRPPEPEYLEFLGETDSDTDTHEGNIDTLSRAGFELEHSVVSSLEAWDRYEDRYNGNMESHLREFPDDPDFATFEAHRNRWRTMYLRHGRGTMGFALYQARKVADVTRKQ